MIFDLPLRALGTTRILKKKFDRENKENLDLFEPLRALKKV